MASTKSAPPTVQQITDFFETRMGVTDTVPLIWCRPPGSDCAMRTVHRIGLALDERHDFSALPGLDALFLHRPFRLSAGTLPNAVIFAVHKGFDDHLSVSYNPVLAQRFALENVQPLVRKEERIGMVGEIAAAPWEGIYMRLVEAFGGAEEVRENGVCETVQRIAFVGAMTPELIEQAADLGATVYVTGQFRRGVQAAAEVRHMAVVAVGHRGAELWGLHQLARELRVAFPNLVEVRVFTTPNEETGTKEV